MVKEFHLRNKYVNYTKSQIQDKEVQLKKDYMVLKEARQQSGASKNEDKNMVQGSPSLWNNLKTSYPKFKKFRNNKARFHYFMLWENFMMFHFQVAGESFAFTILTVCKCKAKVR